MTWGSGIPSPCNTLVLQEVLVAAHSAYDLLYNHGTVCICYIGKIQTHHLIAGNWSMHQEFAFYWLIGWHDAYVNMHNLLLAIKRKLFNCCRTDIPMCFVSTMSWLIKLMLKLSGVPLGVLHALFLHYPHTDVYLAYCFMRQFKLQLKFIVQRATCCIAP